MNGKRLATREFHEWRVRPFPGWTQALPHVRDDFLQLHEIPVKKGVLRIAVDAAQWTSRETHKDASPPSAGALALNAVEYLVDFESHVDFAQIFKFKSRDEISLINANAAHHRV